MATDISYEQHLRQNNERLISITKQLSDVRGYDHGCRELIAWCADPRAFNAAFEDNLLSALQEVVKLSSKNGFDRQLAIALIDACHSHRKLLSKRSAATNHLVEVESNFSVPNSVCLLFLGCEYFLNSM
uniref:Zmiz1 N-terminal tetratricopeptide repeat domain-containing protein n=1 Tax=Ascaris lumbricoides TaxID=6252 RepID=A0A9J2P3N4_ASCLU